jgi:amino acid transporter
MNSGLSSPGLQTKGLRSFKPSVLNFFGINQFPIQIVINDQWTFSHNMNWSLIMFSFSVEKEPTNPIGRFGLFEGVFTPCVLTILGVIMFMRAGFVVGHSGLWLGLTILAISKLITSLTALSLSAISTNTEVRGGGVYFMISRALGPDFGGTIGATLFIAQAVGVSFYVIGFTEALVGSFAPYFPSLGTELQTPAEVLGDLKVPQMISSLVIAGLFYLTFKGADVALKVQNYVLVILLLSILSFLVGGVLKFDSETYVASQAADFTEGMSFWMAFAIFFPACTGITAGANMSGDLKNPESSIPTGTLLAIGFTLLIYVLQMVLVAGASPRMDLKAEPFAALKAMSVFSPLIILGVFAATLSSALGSFLGAPRILQAMGRDGLMSVLSFFAKGEGPSDEPQRATILTFIIALVVIWAGDLNAVAEVISMFFLIAYGTINLSAFVESKGGNPSFRPQFRFFHWTTALLGAIGCGVAMMKINDTYALIALGLSAVIYFYLKNKDIQTNYGDAKRGYIFRGVRNGLRMLEGTHAHPKNWRPVLVAISEGGKAGADTIRVGSWIESGRGLYSIIEIEERCDDTYEGRLALAHEREEQLREFLKSERIQAFPESLMTKNFHEGLFDFLQGHSIGALKANTILIGIPEREQEMTHFYKTLELVATFNLNLVVYKHGDVDLRKKKKKIDLWWRNESNGSLMALFSYLMTLSPDWSGSKIRLLKALPQQENVEVARQEMNELKRQARIDAEVKVLSYKEDAYEVLRLASSQEADFVFIGMGATDGEEAVQSIKELLPKLQSLPQVALVWSNGEANIFV